VWQPAVETSRKLFYVLLTVDSDMILVNKQPDAQFFSNVCLFLFSTCFGELCAHHQENYLYQYDIWYMSLCVDDRLVCRSICSCQPDGHLHRVT